MIFCTNQGFIVHSPRLRSLVATRPYSSIKHYTMYYYAVYYYVIYYYAIYYYVIYY